MYILKDPQNETEAKPVQQKAKKNSYTKHMLPLMHLNRPVLFKNVLYSI